jgi:hypothetical protein
MTPTLLENRGVPLDKQKFTWRDPVQKPIMATRPRRRRAPTSPASKARA